MTTTATDRPHLLIADDDADIRDLITAQLSREGYELTAVGDIAGIHTALRAKAINLIVLDLTLPDGDGLTLCRELREQGYAGSIIMVTARDSALDRVLGLELGADDYLTKPFEPRELTIRVRNLLRRVPRLTGEPQPLRIARFGQWRLDLVKRRLLAPDDSVVMLSTTEFDMLKLLTHAAGRPLSRDVLVPTRAATANFDRTIDNKISRLRQKLKPDGEELILTVRGQGYMLASSVAFE